MATKPGGRGGKKKFTSKGGHRHFSDFEELKKQNEEIKREKAERAARGDEDESEEEGAAAGEATKSKPKVVNFDKQLEKKAPKPKRAGSSSGSASSSEGGVSSSDADDESDDGRAKKGVQHLIEIENPNRKQQKMKKIGDLKLDDLTTPPPKKEDADPAAATASAATAAGTGQLSRKEREAIEKEKARQEYQRLHALGKTDEARADLARLALIRKQREDAAKKQDDEKKAKELAEAKQQKEKLAGKH